MAIRHFVGLILQRAQRDGATEVVIGPAETKAVAVRYKVERTWREIEGAGHETPAMPSFDMRDVVSELTRLARLPEGPFPKAAVRSVSFEGDAEVRWKVEVKGTETDCVFTRLAK